MDEERSRLTDDDLEAQESALLPDREVMSLITTSPGGATGGLLGNPLDAGGGTTAAPAGGTDTGAMPDPATAVPDTSGLTGSAADLAQHAGAGDAGGPYSPVETSSAPPTT